MVIRRIKKRSRFSLKNVVGPVAIASAIALSSFAGIYMEGKKILRSGYIYNASCIEKVALGIKGKILNINQSKDIPPEYAGKSITLGDLLGYDAVRCADDVLAYSERKSVEDLLYSSEISFENKIWNPLGEDSSDITCGFMEERYLGRRRAPPKIHLGLDLIPLPELKNGELMTDVHHEIYAGADGFVADFGRNKWQGKFVDIAVRGGMHVLYSHLSRIDKSITLGGIVRAKQTIGNMGNTGACFSNMMHWKKGKWGKKGHHLDIKCYYIENGEKRFIDPAPLLSSDSEDFDLRTERAIKYLQTYAH
ncbi:MAG: M23 family metallopeptidase [Candidatus Paceibacterota bacterium]